MDLVVRPGTVLENAAELAILGVYQGEALPDNVAGLFEASDFAGKAGQMRLLYPREAGGPKRLLLVGMGARDGQTAESVRRVAAQAVRQARDLKVAAVTVGVQGGAAMDPELAGQSFAEGAMLGGYRYTAYRSDLGEDETFDVESATLFTVADNLDKVQAGLKTGQAVAQGVNFARDLVNRPGYAKTPAALADEAVSLGERTNLKVTVFDEAELVKQGFGGILAVGQGSSNESRFFIMEHGKAGDGPTICLVGKGLTFDSGGLSLKPADAMETMKNDMSGAAAVMGAMQVVSDLNLPIHVVGLVSSAENMPSGTAYRPGDIVRTLSGKTVEVLNTDAEGRIILADALFYAQRYNPAAIVEMSTLTGAIIIALGMHATGMMATDQPLADRISQAGDATAERVWQLPMWDEYHEMVKSDVADLKNMAGRPAGSITAGTFLAAFVGDYPFVHLDVAGTAWADSPRKPYDVKGGTGVGVRLLTEFLRTYEA
jgi:leucyl aminopeptidase